VVALGSLLAEILGGSSGSPMERGWQVELPFDVKIILLLDSIIFNI